MIKRKILLTTDLGLKETLRQIKIQDPLFQKYKWKIFSPNPLYLQETGTQVSNENSDLEDLLILMTMKHRP